MVSGEYSDVYRAMACSIVAGANIYRHLEILRGERVCAIPCRWEVRVFDEAFVRHPCGRQLRTKGLRAEVICGEEFVFFMVVKSKILTNLSTKIEP
jgi:hypothetical protein